MPRPVVLITGSRGLLGRALCERLRGRKLRLVRSSRADCDLSDRAAARRLLRRVRPELIYHLAGTTKALPPRELRRAHRDATVSLLEAAARLPRPPRVLVVGSCHEYGPSPKPLSETAPLRPVSAYGKSKAEQVRAALAFARRGVPVVVARIYSVCGRLSPRHAAVGSFAAQIAELERGRRLPVVETGPLDCRRDFIDARDAADGMIAVMERAGSGEVFNVCSGRARRVGELLDLLAAAARVRFAVVERAGPADATVGDGGKLARRAGFRPRVPLERSLREALAYRRSLAR